MRIPLAFLTVNVAYFVFVYLFPSDWGHMVWAANQILGGTVPTYPAFGYPMMFIPAIVLGINPFMWALAIQGVMLLVGVYLWFIEFKVEVTVLNTFLLLPFVAVMALMQTAAVPCFLVLCAVLLLRRERVWPAALLLGLCGLFRTELLILPLALAMVHFRPAMFVFWVTVFVLFAVTSSVVSTNSPAVFYQSLGQLEGNSWGIRCEDAFTDSISHAHGVEPRSREDAELFTHKSYEAISNDPMAYIEKCFKNLVRAVIGGPYIGEWRIYSWGDWVRYPLHIIFGCVLLWVFVRMPYRGFLFWAVVVLLLSQALGNQMVRHWNVIYLPLLGISLGRRNA